MSKYSASIIRHEKELSNSERKAAISMCEKWFDDFDQIPQQDKTLEATKRISEMHCDPLGRLIMKHSIKIADISDEEKRIALAQLNAVYARNPLKGTGTSCINLRTPLLIK